MLLTLSLSNLLSHLAYGLSVIPPPLTIVSRYYGISMSGDTTGRGGGEVGVTLRWCFGRFWELDLYFVDSSWLQKRYEQKTSGCSTETTGGHIVQFLVCRCAEARSGSIPRYNERMYRLCRFVFLALTGMY